MTPLPGAFRAHAAVTATRRAHGAMCLEELRSSPPLALRWAGGAVWMVGTAGGPLAGDRLALHLQVGPGASLTMRSAAASVVLGGAGGATSLVTVHAEVGAGASLRWLPEPTVATAGCRHRGSASISLAAGASLVWRDELVLGRHGEAPGHMSTRVSVDRQGVALVRHGLRVGPGAPGWDGPAVLGDARATGTVVVVRPGLAAATTTLCRDAAVLAVADDATVISAVAPDAAELRNRLDRGLAGLAAGRAAEPAGAA